MFLILQFSWLEKERKKQFKSQPPLPTINIFSFFQPPHAPALLFHPHPTPTISF